jgi:hypothetical protein
VNADEQLALLQSCYPEATGIPSGNLVFVHIPKLGVSTANGLVERVGLLCPHAYDGYTTRLFFNEQVPGPVNNWTNHSLFTKSWWTWSWNNVVAEQPWLAILANHLGAFR